MPPTAGHLDFDARGTNDPHALRARVGIRGIMRGRVGRVPRHCAAYRLRAVRRERSLGERKVTVVFY